MMRMDYGKYRLTVMQWLLITGVYIGFDFLIAELFYHSVIAVFILLPGYVFFWKIAVQWLKERRLRQLKMEFREWMMLMYSMIAAGASVETAIKDSYKDMSGGDNQKNYMTGELDVMVKKMAMNVPVMTCMEDFAKRAGDEDIYDFYEVMNIARHQGGSMRKIIRSSIDRISEKIEMECEIAVIISGKKHEFLIMTCIPVGMIIYMRLSSPELMKILYTCTAGRVIMTAGLMMYGIAVFWGIHITKIDI